MSMLLRAAFTSKHNSLFLINQRNFTPLIIKNSFSTSKRCNDINTNKQDSYEIPPKRFGLKLFIITLCGVGFGIGLTRYNLNIRKKVESNLPYSDILFKQIDSFFDTYINKKNKPLPETKSEPMPEKLIVKIEEVRVDKEEVLINDNISQQTQTTEDQQASLESLKGDLQINDLDWKQTLKEHELQEEAAIKAIEKRLKSGLEDILLKVNEAHLSCESSMTVLNKYSEQLKLALNENDDEIDSKNNQWLQVTELFEQQSANIKSTNEKINAGIKSIFDLDRLLTEVKSSDSNKYLDNNHIKNIQLELIKQYRQLQSDKSQLAESIVHANVLKTYTNEQKLARNQFLKEIMAIQPEGIKGKLSDDQLSNEELNSLLIHAHKRVLQLQKQINKMQILENQRIQSALEDQRKQFDEIDRENIISALDLQKREFDLEKNKLAEDVRNQMNEELIKELSRQANAHNNHLAKMLAKQQEELSSFYEKKLLIESQAIRKSFYDEVTESFGRLKGIEKAILSRANYENEAQKAKELWLAVQNLNELLATRANDLKDNLTNNDLVEILSNINIIKRSAPNNQFINEVLNSINEKSLNRGIMSAPDLKERFQGVKSVCKKVALIDERGGSLFKYFLSYLQSKFIIKSSINPNKMNHSLELDSLDDLNTFKILDYSQYFIEQGDFEMAIKLLQQLEGEPKNVAEDFINEALLLLEVKQAINLITTFISSLYVGTSINQ